MGQLMEYGKQGQPQLAQSMADHVAHQFASGRCAHQFVKKTDKTPSKELALARKRMKEWKDADA